MDQNIILQASFLEKQREELEGQLEFVSKQIEELEQFHKNLDFISMKEKSLLSSLGKGVYVKTQLEDTRLFVEVGAGVIVKKTPQQVAVAISEQIKKFNEVRTHIFNQIESLNQEFQHILQQLEKESLNS